MQRQLFLNGQLDQGKIDKFTNLGFDFYGSSEEDEVDGKVSHETFLDPSQISNHCQKVISHPNFPLLPSYVFRVRSTDLMAENEALRKEVQELKTQNEVLTQENQALKDAMKDKTA